MTDYHVKTYENIKSIDKFAQNHCRIYKCAICKDVMAELNCNPKCRVTCQKIECKDAWRNYLDKLNGTEVFVPKRL